MSPLILHFQRRLLFLLNMDPLGSTKNGNDVERRLWCKEPWDTIGGKSLTHSGRTACSGCSAVYLSGYVFTIPSWPFSSDGRSLWFSFQTSVLPGLLVILLSISTISWKEFLLTGIKSVSSGHHFPLVPFPLIGYLLERWTAKDASD